MKPPDRRQKSLRSAGKRGRKAGTREELPPGCAKCHGRPWVPLESKRRPNGMEFALGRCDCPRGVWYQQRDRERKDRELQ